ncbi:LacI family transcriptional regulator, partial [Akkermansiaceae bacterium]|nr:LacI family transcriptional regulator [Akkermansiaceae bacterium]
MAGVNQQEIADRLGLSKATVSRCFTNHAGISAVTRAKVFQLAAELGYTHLESRSIKVRKKAKKQPTNFTVLICSDTDEYFNEDYESPGEEILAGVSEYAQLHDAQVEVHFIPPNVTGIDDPAFKKIKGLKDRQSRGIFLIYPFPSPVIDELSVRFPLVSLIDQVQQHNIDCVDVDHFDGISTVVDHLVEQGHERIGFYTRNYTVDASWSFRRYSAFVEKMARLKLKVTQKDTIGI